MIIKSWLLLPLFISTNMYAQALLDKSGWQIYFQDEFNPGTTFADLQTRWDFTIGDNDNNLHASYCEDYNKSWNGSPTYNTNINSGIGNPPVYVPVMDGTQLYNLNDNFEIDANGILHIKMKDRRSNPFQAPDGESYDWTSGALRSKTSSTEPCGNPATTGPWEGTRFGMFEIRCKMSKGTGKYSTFWLSGSHSWPPEFDVFEHNNSTKTEFFSGVHWVSPNTALKTNPTTPTGTNGVVVNCTTPMTIGAGTKTFTLTDHIAICPGKKLVVRSSAVVNNYMVGEVTSYDEVTKVVTMVVPNNGLGCTNYTNWGRDITANECSFNGSVSVSGNSWIVMCSSGECNYYTFQDVKKDEIANANLDDEFHTYTMVWTPDKISFFFDGKEYRTVTDVSQMPNVGDICNYGHMDAILSLSYNCPQWQDLEVNKLEPFLVDYVRIYKPTASNTNWNHKQHYGNKIDNSAVLLGTPTSLNVSPYRFDGGHPAGNVFYKGTDNRMWNYWWNGSSMVQSCVNWSITDVESDVTIATSTGRTYYRTAQNLLKYFDSNSTNYYTGIANCAGSIVTYGNFVYYKDTDGKLRRAWQQPNTIWVSLVMHNTANVAGGIVVNGLDIYYIGTDKNIWKYVISPSSLTKMTTTGNVELSAYDWRPLIYNSTSNKFYFKATGDRLWNHHYWGGAWHTEALSWSSEDGNCANIVAYDQAKDIIYYKSTLGGLWYSFFDKGNRWFSTYTNSSLNSAPITVGSGFVRNDGRLHVWAQGYNTLVELSWTASQFNDIDCNQPNDNNIILYKEAEQPTSATIHQIEIGDEYIEAESVETAIDDALMNESNINLYPIPTDAIVNFDIKMQEDTDAYLFITDLNGKMIEVLHNGLLPIGQTILQYDASKLPAGMYLFSFESTKYVQKGKFIKQ